LGRRC